MVVGVQVEVVQVVVVVEATGVQVAQAVLVVQVIQDTSYNMINIKT